MYKSINQSTSVCRLYTAELYMQVQVPCCLGNTPKPRGGENISRSYLGENMKRGNCIGKKDERGNFKFNGEK
jgi:hypothetical protein